MGANPNTLQGIPETWEKVYQVTHHKVPVYPAFASFRLAAGLQVGDTVHRSYRNSLVAQDMGADGSYSTQAITDTDETLVIDKAKETSFYIKKLDELQNSLPVRAKHAYDSAAAIFNQVDGDVLGDYDQYTGAIDDASINGSSGTSGNGVTVNASNVRQLFSNAKRLLQRYNINLDNGAKFTGFRPDDMAAVRGVAILSPDVYQYLLESIDGKDTAFGDTVGINGHVGRYFGFDLFVSNATGWSGELTLATLPTDADTVTINGVTFTYETGTVDTAGEVKAETSAAVSRGYLVNSINAPGTSVSGQFQALSAANQLLLRNITATDDTTNNKITIKATGYGFVVVSETLTAAADTWTAAKQIQHCLFGVNNSLDLVIQKTPSMEIVPVTGKVGSDVVTWAAYGKKVFNEQKRMMVDVKVRTDAYTANS